MAAIARQLDVVAMAREVMDGLETLATHGFLLTAQIRVDTAVTSAAIARIAVGSSMSMRASDS